jgi:phosphatidyl-myo-inositol dimannoside synthase
LDVIWGRSWYQWIVRRVLPKMDRVVCVSHATARSVRERGVSDEKISVIPCGIWPKPDIRHKTLDMRILRPTLITVGRLIKRKGHLWFLREVMPILLESYPMLRYWIVGKGPQEDCIRSFIYGTCLERHVCLYGKVLDTERDLLLDQSDCFVMPNIPVDGDMEGFGISCIEASGRGVPTVAARLEGLQDAVIEGKTGCFFESGDAKDCAYAVRNALKLYEGVREATLEHFAWPYLLQRYHNEVFS